MSAFQEILYWFKTDARTEKYEFMNLWGTSSKNGGSKRGQFGPHLKPIQYFFC